jgi:hypothetical protein
LHTEAIHIRSLKEIRLLKRDFVYIMRLQPVGQHDINAIFINNENAIICVLMVTSYVVYKIGRHTRTSIIIYKG